MGIPEDEQLEFGPLTKAIENAQSKIEINNFGIRKNLLEYDQVMNEQREHVYKDRKRVLDGDSMRNTVYKWIQDIVEKKVDMAIGDDSESEEWDVVELNQLILPIIPLQEITKEKVEGLSKKELKQKLKEEAVKLYEEKEAEFPEEQSIREVERMVLLKVIDRNWMDHIDDMEQLKQGIGLQAFGQRDPVVEYRLRGGEMYDAMAEMIAEDTVKLLMHVRIEQDVKREQVAKVTGTNKDESAQKMPVKNKEEKVYPNDPCPCGSGKKYKQCCGRNA